MTNAVEYSESSATQQLLDALEIEVRLRGMKPRPGDLEFPPVLSFKRSFEAQKILKSNPQLLEVGGVQPRLLEAFDKGLASDLHFTAELAENFSAGLPQEVLERGYFINPINEKKRNELVAGVLEVLTHGCRPWLNRFKETWDLPEELIWPNIGLTMALKEGIKYNYLAGIAVGDLGGGSVFEMITDIEGEAATSEILVGAVLSPDDLFKALSEKGADDLWVGFHMDHFLETYHRDLQLHIDPNRTGSAEKSNNLFRRMGIPAVAIVQFSIYLDNVGVIGQDKIKALREVMGWFYNNDIRSADYKK